MLAFTVFKNKFAGVIEKVGHVFDPQHPRLQAFSEPEATYDDARTYIDKLTAENREE